MMAAMTDTHSSASTAIFDALGHGPADRRLAILREIGAGGSISQAARSVGVSYKAAWQALDTLTNLAGVPLVERVVGGVGGGGARLTEAAHELLAAADALHAARTQLASQLQPGSGTSAATALRLSVQTSMRNQWPCRVQALHASGPIVRVQLCADGPLPQPLVLWSRITRESCELLALRPGLAVQAWCKATAVQVWRAAQAPQPLPANHWPGRAVRLDRGSLGDEVALDAGGLQLVGFAAAGSRLRRGAQVVASVDEAAVALVLAGH